MQIDWSEEIVAKKTPRNINSIELYRQSTPVHTFFASIAQQAGLGCGSLRNLYIPFGSKRLCLLVMDPKARGCVPTGVAKRIAETLDINAVAADFSAYTKQSILAQLRSDDGLKTDAGYIASPRYAEGEALLKCENLRTGSTRNLSVKQLADYIMQRSHAQVQSTDFASWKTEKQEDSSRPVALTDETYKLLDDPADFVDFHTKAINSDILKVIDFDVILYDRTTFQPLLMCEVKHAGGAYWHVTKATAETLSIPAGLVVFDTRDEILSLTVEGFGLPESQAFSKSEFAEFIIGLL